MKISAGIVIICLLTTAFANPRLRQERIREEFRNMKTGVSKHDLTRHMPEYLLPTDIAPVRQWVSLWPFLVANNLTFNGQTRITFDCVSSTQDIIVHQLGMTISDVTVEEEGGATVDILSENYDAEKEWYVVSISSPCSPGVRYVMNMNFQGQLNSDAIGFYYSSYDKNGTEVYYAITQGQPDYQRMSFPCFDQPDIKYIFEIELIRPNNWVTGSNTRIVSSTLVPGQTEWTADLYEETPVMSSYLIALHVSDFEIRNIVSGDYSYGIYATADLIDYADYAFVLTPIITDFFGTYFRVPYQLPKQDQISLNFFQAGAMENWGFITYRDEYLMYDEQRTPAYIKEFICEIIAHELVHQWFGNQVTTKIWDHLWLNEGFATWFSYPGCSSSEPQYGVDVLSTFQDQFPAFRADDSLSSRPIIMDLTHPNELQTAFGTITYSKGGMVLKMLSYFLSESVLLDGLEIYLNRHAYNNTVTDDLWQALQEAVDVAGTLGPLTVKEIMDNWTLRSGFPLITVTNNLDGTATVTQERFLIDPTEVDPDGSRWHVPITYTTQASPNFEDFNVQWLTPDDSSITLTGIPTDPTQWFILNIKAGGFFRVNYDQNTWFAISQQLLSNHSVIDERNRALLINDAWNLQKSERLQADMCFQIHQYIKNEDNYTPIATFIFEHDYVERMFRGKPEYANIWDFYVKTLGPIYQRLGFADSPSDPVLTQMTRGVAYSFLCEIRDNQCLVDSSALYNSWMTNTEDLGIITPTMRYTVYCGGIANGGVSEWNVAYTQYLEEEMPDERYNLLYGLGCTNNSALHNQLLTDSFDSGSGIPTTDISSIMQAVSLNEVGQDVAWTFILNNDQIISNYMGSYSFVANYVNTVSRYFNSDQKMAELQQFRTDNIGQLTDSSSLQTVDNAIVNVQRNLDWITANLAVIDSWLTDNQFGPGKND